MFLCFFFHPAVLRNINQMLGDLASLKDKLDPRADSHPHHVLASRARDSYPLGRDSQVFEPVTSELLTGLDKDGCAHRGIELSASVGTPDSLERCLDTC